MALPISILKNVLNRLCFCVSIHDLCQGQALCYAPLTGIPQAGRKSKAVKADRSLPPSDRWPPHRRPPEVANRISPFYAKNPKRWTLSDRVDIHYSPYGEYWIELDAK